MSGTYAPRELEFRVRALLDAYRTYGHLAADLDPLGLFPRDWSNLQLERFGLSEADLETVMIGPGCVAHVTSANEMPDHDRATTSE